MLLQAIKNKKKEEIREQWVVQLPLMAIKYLEYKSFEDYYNHITGGDIDTRPTEEILAEVAEVRKYTGG